MGSNELSFEDQEWLKCAQSFEYFASKYIKIVHPKEGLVNFKLFAYQKRAVADFEEFQFNIVSKFRQGGLTTLAVIWCLWRAMFKKHQLMLVMSRTDREAIGAGEIVKVAIETMVEEHPWLAPKMQENSKHQKLFEDTGSKIMFYTPEAARGKSARIIVIDEAAFIPKMEQHWTAMYPVISTGGSVIAISTVNGRGNWYEKQYTDAQNGRNKFHVIDIDYQEHPDYCNPEWVKKTKANMSEKAFAQEYERSFHGSGDTFLKTHILSALAAQVRDREPLRKLYPEWDSEENLGEWYEESNAFNRGALHIFQEPIDGREYIIGVDVGEGVGADNSTFQIIDGSSLEQVAEFCSNIIDMSVFSQILSIVGNYYNIAQIAVENVGPGLTIVDKLQHSLYYENMYYPQTTKRTEKAGIVPNRSVRPLMLETMKNLFTNNFVKISSRRLVRELDTFITNKQTHRAEAMRNYHDDLIMAYAIALHVRDLAIRNIPVGMEGVENLADSLKTETFESLKRELERGTLRQKDKEDKKDPWEILPAINPGYKRPFDAILKEFNW